jgi:uncharacterized protein YbcI
MTNPIHFPSRGEEQLPRRFGQAEDAMPDGELSAALSNAIVALMAEYTGRGATQSKTCVNENLITCIMHDSLTKGERSLVTDGKEDAVLEMRRTYQETMRPELIAIVERLTGGNVAAFMSANHVDPDVAVETFVLELSGIAADRKDDTGGPAHTYRGRPTSSPLLLPRAR